MNKIKYLLIAIFLIATFYMFVAFIIIPDLKRKNDLKTDIVKLESKIDTLKENYSELQNRYFDLSWYRGYLKYLNDRLSAKDLKNILMIYSESVNIKRVDSMQNGKFKIKIFFVTIKIKTPKDFYSFLDYIEKNRLPIKIGYPIEFEKKDRLKLKFNLFVYSF